MNDIQGNTPRDLRPIALADPDERWHFTEQFVKDHPDSTADDVESVLDEAADSIAPSESRELLVVAVEKALGLDR